MSVNVLNLNKKKEWLNVRCNNMTVDGDLILNGATLEEKAELVTQLGGNGTSGDITIRCYKIGNSLSLLVPGVTWTFSGPGNTVETQTALDPKFWPDVDIDCKVFYCLEGIAQKAFKITVGTNGIITYDATLNSGFLTGDHTFETYMLNYTNYNS